MTSTWPETSALGVEVGKQRADRGEGEAQFSMGCSLVYLADEGAAGTETRPLFSST